MQWAFDNSAFIVSLLFDHLTLVIWSLPIAVVLSLATGVIACKYRTIEKPIVTLTQLLYTIPALPLLVIIPLLVGVPLSSSVNVAVALGVYALALLVRSSVDALRSVEQEALLSAKGLGYSDWEILIKVQLPLSLPAFLAGLRVAAMSTIALASIGALVGVPSLGNLLTDGFQRGIVEEIIVGIGVIVIVAVVVDGILLLLGRTFLPWMRYQK